MHLGQGEGPRLPSFLRHNMALFERVLILIYGPSHLLPDAFWLDLMQLSSDVNHLPSNVKIFEQLDILPLATMISSHLSKLKSKVLFLEGPGSESAFAAISSLDLYRDH